MSWDGHCRNGRNLLILNWLSTCAKINGKLGLFLRGYPRASFFTLGVALVERVPD